MSDREVKAKITLEDQLTPALKKIQESLQGFHGGVVSLAAGLDLVKDAAELVYKGFEAVKDIFKEAFNEALEGEKATNRLKGAMVQAGVYTEELDKTLKDHIEVLEKEAGASGTVAKGMIATGLQMGLTAQKAQELEQAARQLAAANNIDVNEAFSALQTSLAGNSRALGKLIPQVKDLGQAQLKQGEAIDIVNKATKAQYELYQQSLPAALSKAKIAFENIYQALGETITKSPALTAVINELSKLFNGFSGYLKENQEVITDWINKGILLAIDVVMGLATAFDAIYRVGVATFNALRVGTDAFGLAILKTEEKIYTLMSHIPGLGDAFLGAARDAREMQKSLDEDMQKSMQNIDDSLKGPTAAYKAVEEKISGMREAVVIATAAQGELTKAQEKSLITTSAHNAAVLKLQNTYDGFSMGTRKQREALQGEVQDRAKNLKDFTEYLDAREQLAVSKAENERIEVDKIRSAAVKSTGGQSEAEANAQAAVDAEIRTQAQLDVLMQKKLLSRQAYDEATLASDQRAAEAEFQFQMANANAKADLLGESEAGFQLKQQTAEQHFQIELQNKLARAQQEGLATDEIRAMQDIAQAEHNDSVEKAQQAHDSKLAEMEVISGQTITATRAAFYDKQKASQTQAVKAFASGVTMMESLQTGMNNTFSQLGDALVKNQRITASNMAGVFLEMFGRQVMQKGFGDIVMGIFPPNPALLAAGAAEIAVGTGIARLGAGMQKGQGGQAHEGMDNIPQSLSNRSFIVSGGERVVQPEANKDLTAFLSTQRSGAAAPTYNVTLNYTGSGGAADARSMADIVITEIRRRSERGTPIMSPKGLTG